MPIPVTLNNVAYQIPTTNERDWGQNVTSYLVAVSTSVLQKSGGYFPLTADVDFGLNFGIRGIYFRTRATDSATVGTFRLAHDEFLAWRNAANTADLSFSVDSGDKLNWNGNVMPLLPPSGAANDVLKLDTTTAFEFGKIDKANLTAALQELLTPSGLISAFGGSVAPNGYLLCNGQEVSKTDYADLYAAIGDEWNTKRDQSTGANYATPTFGNFRLPDLRGVFLRGAGTSSGYSATTLGATQDDATAKNGLANAASSVSASGSGNTGTESASHTHGAGSLYVGNLYATSTAYGYANVGTANRWDDRTSVGSNNQLGGSTGTQSANHTHGFSVSVSGTAAAQAITGDSETRPVNVGVNYIIKY